ncbi:MAG TPA: zinc metallopeptidase [Planctomycetaceae bacterium]|nr:zinc metallopeptidase [Planctomycetaceae bacterium]
MIFFDPRYFLFILPAVLLMAYAQIRLRSAFSQGMQIPTPLSGAAAARYILDQGGLQEVEVEMVGGMLSDHYDPRHRVLRLSRDVYQTKSAAAVGIAAHEAGHALQHATNYAPLVIRNAAVPAAQFGPMLALVLIVLGALFNSFNLIVLGLIAFGGIVVFQLINLPVEYDASSRAKRILREYRIVDDQGEAAVESVLSAAALTYVAATLQSILQLAYYAMILLGGRRSD